ncbi:type II secretion system F family protein [Spirochaeta dissipatitropha]
MAEIQHLPAVFQKNKLNRNAMIHLTGTLSSLLKSGLELQMSLLVALRSAHRNDRHAIKQIISNIQAGTTFSDALSMLQIAVPDFFIQLLRTGEKSNNLLPVIIELNKYLQNQKKLKDTISASLVYPSMVLIIGIVSFSIILHILQPQLAQLSRFTGMTETEVLIGTRINTMTELLSYGFISVSILVLLTRLCKYFPERIRCYAGSIIDRLPVAGSMTMVSELYNWSHIMKIQLEAGIGIETAVFNSISGCSRIHLRQEIQKIYEAIMRGRSVASAFSSGIFPDFIHNLLYVGQKSGHPEIAINQIHAYFQDKVEKNRKIFWGLIEPLFISITGLILAAFIYSIILPIFGVYGELL